MIRINQKPRPDPDSLNLGSVILVIIRLKKGKSMTGYLWQMAGLLPSWCPLGRCVLPPPPTSRLGRCDWRAGADRQHIVHPSFESSEKKFRSKRQLTTGVFFLAKRKYCKFKLNTRVADTDLDTMPSVDSYELSFTFCCKIWDSNFFSNV